MEALRSRSFFLCGSCSPRSCQASGRCDGELAGCVGSGAWVRMEWDEAEVQGSEDLRLFGGGCWRRWGRVWARSCLPDAVSGRWQQHRTRIDLCALYAVGAIKKHFHFFCYCYRHHFRSSHQRPNA